MIKKITSVLDVLGVPASWLAVPAAAALATKLYFELVKLSAMAVSASQWGAIGLGMSIGPIPMVGAGLAVAGYGGAAVVTILAIFEIYNTSLAICFLFESAGEELVDGIGQ